MPLHDITAQEHDKANQRHFPQKIKKTRLLLDARTELTDEELKVKYFSYG